MHKHNPIVPPSTEAFERATLTHAGSRLHDQQAVATGLHGVHMSGQINFRTAPELATLVRRICTDFGAIERDLTDVTVIDTTGLRTLQHIKAICAEHCAELAIIPPGGGSPACGRSLFKRRR